MNLILLRTPQGNGHRVFRHRFPPDLPPGTAVNVAISGVQAELLAGAGILIAPAKRQANQHRHKRSTEVEMEFGQKVVPHELEVNLTTGEVFLLGRIYSPLFLSSQVLTPLRTTLTTYYDRKGKRKLLHAYFQGPGRTFLGIDRVFEFYDRVFCVDTNTGTTSGGQKVAVTTAIAVTSKRVGENAIHIGSDHSIQLVARDPPPGNPEIYGIWSMLAAVLKEKPALLQGRLAIITDTEYTKVKAWHERAEPFYDGHHLPSGVDIFYATADSGSDEFMPNKLMRICDSLSGQKLREILAG